MELVGAFLLGYAAQLNQAYANGRSSGETSCGIADGDCFLGWEADVALKMAWGENDILRWSTEFGLMHAGAALGPTVLAEPWLWTLQSRIAMVF